jgi:VIT1/CCC1 family predicted Fe2+/Mn2+ transporter
VRVPFTGRVLDPIERTCEIMFGVIMVLTFTGSISVAAGTEETRTELVAAIACNLAWGIIDSAMYLITRFAERARELATLRAVRETGAQDAAHRRIRAALPSVVSAVITPSEIETLRQRLDQQPEPLAQVPLKGEDFKGAAAVFLLVFLSTLPIVVPFIVVREGAAALRVSNAIAITLLFVTGWSLGTYAGRPRWRVALGTVGIGAVLVAITIALGG